MIQMNVEFAVVTAHPVQTVLVYQMVRTLIRVVDVEYMISCQQMAVMIYVVLH